jgi:hypothetical protein
MVKETCPYNGKKIALLILASPVTGIVHPMSTSMKLQFHQETLDLIKTTPQRIELSESYAGLPPGVREWYSLTDGVSLLAQYSNKDALLPLENFVTCEHGNKKLIVFMYENQGVVWWAFDPGAGDDPPVYLNLDPPPNNWVFCCERFSIFIYTRLFDFRHRIDPENCVMGIGKPLDPSVEAILSEEFLAGPITFGWPGTRQIRFTQADVRITIHEDSQQSDWYFTADTTASLRKVFFRFRYLFDWYLPHDLII